MGKGRVDGAYEGYPSYHRREEGFKHYRCSWEFYNFESPLIGS
jgi:hypothetical protein